MNIPKRVSAAILNSLTAGVVPRIGLEYIAVGRKNEIKGVLNDLNILEEGGTWFRFLLGRYGSGKSFMLQLIRNRGLELGFVVADADLSPERRLTGVQGLGTYRELISRIATPGCPGGGALETILEKWICRNREKGIREELGKINKLVHGYDFGSVILTYLAGHEQGEEELKKAALRWLRGEYSTKAEARRSLKVTTIIDEYNWFDYLKLVKDLIVSLGYKGVLILLDEGINLYKISHPRVRNNNYEKLLTIFNECMQGRNSHLGIILGGTPRFLEDRDRGVFSYEALETRLRKSSYDCESSLFGPVIRLKQLSHEEIFLLLENLKKVHEIHYTYSSSLGDEQIILFMERTLERIGAEKLLTPREVVRNFLGILNSTFSGRPFEELVKAGEKCEESADFWEASV